MKCTKCDGKTTVIDSRAVGLYVGRQRKCKICGHKFYTEEVEVEECEALMEYRREYYKKSIGG